MLTPEIASMCVSLENESERATVIQYIFLIVFSVLHKFCVKANKRQVKIDKFIKCPERLFESLLEIDNPAALKFVNFIFNFGPVTSNNRLLVEL